MREASYPPHMMLIFIPFWFYLKKESTYVDRCYIRIYGDGYLELIRHRQWHWEAAFKTSTWKPSGKSLLVQWGKETASLLIFFDVSRMD